MIGLYFGVDTFDTRPCELWLAEYHRGGPPESV